jgi:hypothetical protein
VEAPVTTGVGAEVTDAEPALFEAVTSTRTVRSSSAAVNMNELAVAGSADGQHAETA